MEKTFKKKIKIPLLPNFVFDEDGNQYSLKTDFTKEELRELMNEWTEAIIARLDAHPTK